MLAKGPFTEEQSKEELQTAIREDALVEYDPLVFCPLIKGLCNKSCVCYCIPYHTGTGKNCYVRGSYCGNAMFTNE